MFFHPAQDTKDQVTKPTFLNLYCHEPQHLSCSFVAIKKILLQEKVSPSFQFQLSAPTSSQLKVSPSSQLQLRAPTSSQLKVSPSSQLQLRAPTSSQLKVSPSSQL